MKMLATGAERVTSRRRGLRLLLAIGLASFLSIHPSMGEIVPAAPFQGRTITKIVFEPPDQPYSTDELHQLLPVKPGSSIPGA